MVLHRLKTNNFKSIYGDFEICFDDIKGFWKIEGSVGSGKTTIGEAIIFGLFGKVKGKNNTELISWGEKKGSVFVEADSKGHNLKIYRQIEGETKVYIDDQPLVFTNKLDAQAKLENEYYDISKMTLELLCIISFNNFKSLSNMNPSDTRAFLDQIFGFSVLTSYSDECKNFKKSAYDEIIRMNYEKNNLVSQIKKINDIYNTEIIEGTISKTKQDLKEIKENIKNYKENQRNYQNSIKLKLSEKQEKLASIKALGTNKAKEIKLIESGICPTCGAKIDSSMLETKKKEKEVFLRDYKEISEEIKEIQDIYKTESKKYEEKITELEKKQYATVRLLAKLEEQENRGKISSEEINVLQEKLKKTESEIEILEKDEQEWGQLCDILSNSVRQKIINDFIPALNNAIQEYTRQLNLPYIVEFNDQFKCSVNLFGIDRQVSINSLSTGQLKTIDMCIILGVLKIIFSRVNFNIMFLDELFSNMDADLRSMVCNVLISEKNKEHTTFIISHQRIPETVFDGLIEARLVYKDNREHSEYTITDFSFMQSNKG